MKKICSILLFMISCNLGVLLFAEEIRSGSISGRLMIKDSVPMADGMVYIFSAASGPPPSFERYWRVPDEIIRADSVGKFVANLPNGTYYLGAIKRKSGEDTGPLREGDIFLTLQRNGMPRELTVVNGTTIDIGTISGARPYSNAYLKNMTGITAIEGTISDADGQPLEKALVFAYLTPAMLGKPLFIAEKTGADGKYLLRVNEGGNYYLKIRNVYGGGALKAGEIMGNYGQDHPLAVAVKTGTIVKGINITGSNFSRQGQKKNGPNAP